jgi:heme-degrading monooxygenase HmoA
VYVRINHVRFKRGKAKEAAEVGALELAPLMQRARGFRGWYSLQAEDDPDAGLSIGLWDSKADFEALAKVEAYREAVGKIRTLYAEPSTQRFYNVTATVEPVKRR